MYILVSLLISSFWVNNYQILGWLGTFLIFDTMASFLSCCVFTSLTNLDFEMPFKSIKW